MVLAWHEAIYRAECGYIRDDITRLYATSLGAIVQTK